LSLAKLPDCGAGAEFTVPHFQNSQSIPGYNLSGWLDEKGRIIGMKLRTLNVER
jgi:hypothetical protein